MARRIIQEGLSAACKNVIKSTWSAPLRLSLSTYYSVEDVTMSTVQLATWNAPEVARLVHDSVKWNCMLALDVP